MHGRPLVELLEWLQNLKNIRSLDGSTMYITLELICIIKTACFMWCL